MLHCLTRTYMFAVFRDIWPKVPVFLCLWHVRRAWQKHSCHKIKDAVRRAEILREIGLMMYDQSSPTGPNSETWANDKLNALRAKYPREKEFWDYMTSQWGKKIHMWVVGYRNLPYAGQDTNAAIEGYHGFLKSVLKAERSRMVGRRVDWTITSLTEDVHDHFWYKGLRKEKGFIENKKMQDVVVSALMKAREIPDSDVALNQLPGNCAVVTSQEHRDVQYVVHNPGEEWAGCNCVWAQRGNICKHVVKVLLMIRPAIAEGTIARFRGKQAGNATGGMGRLLSPTRLGETMETVPSPVPTPHPTPAKKAVRAKDLGEALRQLVIDLSEEVTGDPALMDHLVADLNQVLGRIRALKVEIRNGTVHPMVASPMLQTVNDGRNFTLIRDKDFLERKGKFVARRLRMQG